MKRRKKGCKALALVMLLQHPEWSNARIAAAAGCSRETLSRWPLFRAARSSLKETDRLVRGAKINGCIEAILPEHEK